MSTPIRPILPPEHIDVVSLSQSLTKPARQAEPQASFSDVFQQSVNRVDRAQTEAREMANAFMKGEDREVHEVVLAAQRAELTFDYFLQVRNKVVQAYQEIMRMQM
ncbi:MAG: flagellar hook-basal body complex protein FliE [Acidobacteria bacterium]|nr:flagellar hook-basal body complex protein FliE [Acidobacteriota bacterium]